MSIVQSGERYQITNNITGTHSKLPQGVYLLQADNTGFFLNKKEDFKLPSKVYGDHTIVKRWLVAAESAPKNLGIILSGLKGSGKTITAHKFCIESGYPVIIIQTDYRGPAFVDFITNPHLGKCIIFIDEFEKIYSENGTDVDLLSLMDGSYPTNLIFLLTVNNFNINEYLINRLGRIRYRKEYTDLDRKIVDAVLDDLLVNQDHRESVYEFFNIVNLCTFDLLVHLISEMNLFNEDALTCGRHLNLKAETRYYEIYEIFDGKEYACYGLNWSPNLKSSVNVERKEIGYLKTNVDTTPISRSSRGLRKLIGEEISGTTSYEIRLNLSECEIEKLPGGSFIINDPKQNVKFRFKPTSMNKHNNANLF